MALSSATIPQPFPYQGSKRKLGPKIVQCLPARIDRLIEPFAGSAAISVAVAWAGKARRFWLNDTHQALVDLWKRIIHDVDGLSRNYAEIWEAQHGREREQYNEVRNEFNRTHRPELLLFLLARCVKAAIRYNRKGQFNNSPDHRRKGMRPATMARNLKLISQALGPNTRMTSWDYTRVLAEAKPVDLVYMDPPYQGVCKNRDPRYVDAIRFVEFAEALEVLNERGVPFIVSYDGRTGDRTYGRKLPSHLGLYHAEIYAGRSTQATLLGRNHDTYESLYLSPALTEQLTQIPESLKGRQKPLALFD